MENQNFWPRTKNHSLYVPIVSCGLAATWLPSMRSYDYIKYTGVLASFCLDEVLYNIELLFNPNSVNFIFFHNTGENIKRKTDKEKTLFSN